MGICHSIAPPQSTAQQIQSQTINSPNSISSPSNNMSSSKFSMKNDSASIIKRILIILSEYYKLTNAPDSTAESPEINWNNLFGSSCAYSDEWLINDFNYILDNFNDDEDIEKIHNQLIQKINDKNNILNLNKNNKTSILYRHLICDKWEYNTKQSISDLYFNSKDTNNIMRYKLLDKIFIHFMYPHILGLRLTFNEIQSIDLAASSNDQKDKTDEDLDLGLCKLNEIIHKKREKWNELKGKEWMKKYADEKFVTYLFDNNNEDSKSNDEIVKVEKEIEKDERDNNNGDKDKQQQQQQRRISYGTQRTEYSIGSRYYYDEWNYYSENCNKLKISESLIIRGSHYTNLKSEMIESLGLTIFEWLSCELYCKNYLFKSKKCRRLKCDILKSDGHGIDIHYGYKQGDAILLQHIISIFIYINYPNIKRKFHRHLSDNKYTNFGRLLREIVEGFGISVFSDDSENEFYTNININNNFNGYLALKFCKPTLMTHMNNIIHLYNYENKYPILNLCKYTNSSSVNYFQCNWLSDNSLDNECLYIGGKYALKLKSIILNNINNYSHYLNAIHILSSLIKGKANTIPIDKQLLFAIETLTKNKLGNNNILLENNNDESKENEINKSYMMNIFNKFCSNINIPIYINLIWILDASKHGYKLIKQWITNDDNSWIRFDVLCCLFPNVEKVKIGHSQFNLMDQTFVKFINFFNDRDGNKKYKLKEITFEDPNEENISVKNIIQKYQQNLNQIGWKMESNKYYTKIFITKKTEDNLWDDLF